MTLSAMPLGLQCAPWKWKFVLLNWCGCEGLPGSIPVGRQVVDEPHLQGFPRLHAQRRAQPAFVTAQVEAHAADVAIGVGAAQAGAEHAVDGAADLGLDHRLVHRRHNRRLRHPEFVHVDVRAVGLPQRSAPAQCQRADRQAGLQQAAS
jgi:hypothetical protein